MGHIKTLGLTAEQQAELDEGLRNGKTHAFRKRCLCADVMQSIRRIIGVA